jgi:hypothetical protein
MGSAMISADIDFIIKNGNTLPNVVGMSETQTEDRLLGENARAQRH